MPKLVHISALLAAALAASSGAFAQPGPVGTPGEAKAMIERAIHELKIDESAAIAKFRSGAAGFTNRDLYVYCFNSGDGRILASRAPDMIGRDVRTLRDDTGKNFGLELYSSALDGQISLSTGYAYPRPGGAAAVQKASYLTRVGNVACGVDFFK